MEGILYISIVNVILVFKLWWDWRAKNIHGRIINHELSALIDGVLYTASAWVLFGMPEASGWVVLAVGYRWVMFDILFNKINNDDWNHYGTSSSLDRFLTKLGKYHLVPKIIIIAIGIALIIFV